MRLAQDPRPLFYVTGAPITHTVWDGDGRQAVCHTDWTWDFAGRACAACLHARYRQCGQQGLWDDAVAAVHDMRAGDGAMVDDGLLPLDVFLAKVDAVLADCARWQRGPLVAGMGGNV